MPEMIRGFVSGLVLAVEAARCATKATCAETFRIAAGGVTVSHLVYIRRVS